MTLVLIGAHGAGKSTIGAALSRRLGWSFHDEIGRWLMERARPAEATAETPQSAFDLAVFSAELARDRGWPADRPRIVESWHPVNLAYARRRSPELSSQFLADIRSECKRQSVLVVPLRRRHRLQSEPGDPAFFDQIGQDAETIAAELGLRCTPPLFNDGTVQETVDQILQHQDKRQWQKFILPRVAWNGSAFASRTSASVIRR